MNVSRGIVSIRDRYKYPIGVSGVSIGVSVDPRLPFPSIRLSCLVTNRVRDIHPDSRNDAARRARRGETPQQKSSAGRGYGGVGRAMVEGGVAWIWAEAVVTVRIWPRRPDVD